MDREWVLRVERWPAAPECSLVPRLVQEGGWGAGMGEGDGSPKASQMGHPPTHRELNEGRGCALAFPKKQPMAQSVKNLPTMQENAGAIPGLGRSPGKGNGNPFQYSCLENPMDRGAWWATVHGVTELDTI